MKICKFIFKTFSKNVITIPPKLRAKNPVKENKMKSSPIYNLLRSDKLAESSNEKKNVQEKIDYETILQEASKSMLINYYKIYEDKIIKEKDFYNLCEYMQKFFNSKELNIFINVLRDMKKIIESDNVEKTEEVFKMFIDKVYAINANKTISKTLISYLSKLSLKELSPEEIFKKTHNQKDFLSDKNSNDNHINKPLQKAIYFSQLESSYMTSMNIRNPVTNDIDKPETDFKDAFLMKYEYTFKEPLLIQKNTSNTKFDFSNYVFFTNMPFFYPVQENETNKTGIKHLNNEIIIKNGINLLKSPEFRNFVEKYLSRAVEAGYNIDSNYHQDKNIKVEILNMFSQITKHNDYYDMNLVTESLDFIQEVFDSTEESHTEAMNNVSRYKNYFKTNINEKKHDIMDISKILEQTKYLQLRKNEVEKELKSRIKDPILCSGLVQFNNYEDKKLFLKSGAGVFGIHLQGKNVRFSDADFSNILEIKQYIGEISIPELQNFLNLKLKIKNAHSLLLDVPNYVADLADINNKIIEGNTQTVYIRFNSFLNALKAYEIFREDPFKSIISVKLNKPVIRFYNGHFFSGLELVLKNTITDLDKILSVNSNYCEINNILEKEMI